MRKFIIDTDTASDDAAALIMAAFDKNIDILGVTSVAGNVSLEQATVNALATLEVCDCKAPVYKGSSKPLFRDRHETISVHGKDGMGDCGIVSPSRQAEKTSAVDFIIDTVRKYPEEVEIAVLGPATNIALAIKKDKETMKKVRRIWSMGTAGFGRGNATPVAEFNVFIDAEAYAEMLESGIPITIIGLDLCFGGTEFSKIDLETFGAGNKVGQFLERATSCLLQFNIDSTSSEFVSLPDALAMAAALWDGFILESKDCYCKCCTDPNETYGQVILYEDGIVYEAVANRPSSNASVITKVDKKLFKDKFLNLMI